MNTVDSPALAPSPPDPAFEHVIKKRYRVIRELPGGPIGTLYLAEDVNTGNLVAVRMLGSEFAEDEQFASALERHALRLAALSITSESIVKACEFDRVGQSALLIATEHVDGKSLSDLMQGEGPLPVGRALHLAIQIAQGLEAAHRLGLIHGGLTPQNVVVTERDEAKLMDFGLAGLRNASAMKRPWYRGAIGAEYLAPEQLEGAEMTVKTDIYALGTALYQMLCGAVPFATTGPNVALAKQLYEAPALPGKLRRHVPSGVARIVRLTLVHRPERRPDIQVVLDDLQREARRLENSRRGKRGLPVRALVGSVKDLATQSLRLSAKWKIVTSCALLVLIAVPLTWIAVSAKRSDRIPAPVQHRSPPVAAEGAQSQTPTPQVQPSFGSAETPSGKNSPEPAVSPKKVAPLASSEKHASSRQPASPSAPVRDTLRPEAGPSDPSDPAGVIDWLLKEHSASNR